MVHNQISSVSPRDSWEPFLIIAIAMASEPSQVSTEAILEEIYNSIGGSLFCLKIVGNGCDMREPNTILRYFETNLRQKRCVCCRPPLLRKKLYGTLAMRNQSLPFLHSANVSRALAWSGVAQGEYGPS